VSVSFPFFRLSLSRFPCGGFEDKIKLRGACEFGFAFVFGRSEPEDNFVFNFHFLFIYL
jgi:hypothetical protein